MEYYSTLQKKITKFERKLTDRMDLKKKPLFTVGGVSINTAIGFMMKFSQKMKQPQSLKKNITCSFFSL